jgi:cell division protein ZapA
MKSIKVSILGKQYPLKIQEQDEEMIIEIARYVDERFHEFRKTLLNQSESTIMVLACLSIAEELFLYKNQQTESAFLEINRSLRDIIYDIEQENSDI